MIVITKEIPGRFNVTTDRGSQSLNQDELVKLLQKELDLKIEIMDTETEEELESLRNLQESLKDLLRPIIKSITKEK